MAPVWHGAELRPTDQRVRLSPSERRAGVSDVSCDASNLGQAIDFWSRYR
jgi:hypothetical protein